MTFKKHFLPVFYIILPLIWAYIVHKALLDKSSLSPLVKNLISALGGILSSFLFYLREIKSRDKMEQQMLQHVLSKSNGDTVLISQGEQLQLGSLMKKFKKMPGRVQNASNNTEGLCIYKLSDSTMVTV